VQHFHLKAHQATVEASPNPVASTRKSAQATKAAPVTTEPTTLSVLAAL